MALTHAVLGLVIERPSYGYEISQRLDDRCPTRGWARNHVYKALSELEAKERVRCTGARTRGDSGRGVRRTIYAATPSGQAMFRDWLRERSTPFSPSRQELDLKIRFATPDSLPHLIEQIRNQELECLSLLQTLLRRPAASGPLDTLEATSALLERNGEFKALQTRVECLQEASRSLEELRERRSV